MGLGFIHDVSERRSVSRDPYKVLGVERGASADDVRRAYRRLAKENHPDMNPDDEAAEKRFKEASAAFDLLGDDEKRARFDRGEIDGDGNPTMSFGFGTGGEGPRAGGTRTFFRSGFDDFGDLFGDLFEGGFGRTRTGPQTRAAPPPPLRAEVTVELADAALGGKARVTTPDGGQVEVTIPPGLKDGQILRLRGKGGRGPGGAPRDLMVRAKIKPHPQFVLDGRDVRMTLDISLKEALLGAKVTAPTLDGPVQLAIPKGSRSGATLRLRARGATDPESGERGDMFVSLRLALPDGPDPELEAFLASWSRADAPVRQA